MVWKFKRRLRCADWKRQVLYYIGVAFSLILVWNIVVINLHFDSVESEIYIDAGGTSRRKHGTQRSETNVFHVSKIPFARTGLRYAFESRLRKLLEIMEIDLDNNVANVVTENVLTYDTYFPDRQLYCDDVMNITNMTFIASGWTKAVYKGVFRDIPVAIKTVDVKGQDVTTCMNEGNTETTCFVKAAKKIVKEIVVLQALTGQNVLKVLGFCLPRDTDDNLWVAMVTELGEAVDLIKLLQMSWEDRLRISMDVTAIVNMMSETPYGSLAMNDFRRQQFVLVNGVLKLSDVDDIGFRDLPCTRNSDCHVDFASMNFTQISECVHGRCVELNEKRNIFNAGRHFVIYLLPHGAPPRLQPIVEEIVAGYTYISMTSEQLLAKITSLKQLYQSGWYLNRTEYATRNASYKRLTETDMPGFYDYLCRLSVAMATCTVSVYDQIEAEDLCNQDDHCRAFVMVTQKTWTGRTVVHFKNTVGSLRTNTNTTLFVKPS